MNQPPSQTARAKTQSPEVIECDAVPVDRPGSSAPPRAERSGRSALPLLFWAGVVLAIVFVFKLAGLAIAAVVALVRNPGALLAVAGGMAGWMLWRKTKRARTRPN
jgi:hypothetical protein